MKIIQRTITIAVPDEECRDQAAADNLMDELMPDADEVDAMMSVITHSKTTVQHVIHPTPKDERPTHTMSDDEWDEALKVWYAACDAWECKAKEILKEMDIIQ